MRSTCLLLVAVLGCGGGAAEEGAGGASGSATASASGTATGTASASASASATATATASGTATASTGGGCSPTGPIGNAILLASGDVIGTQPVTAACPSTRSIGFVLANGTLTGYGEDASALWTLAAGDGYLFGGFDFDNDGWPDAGIVRSTDTGTTCGMTPVVATSIDVVSGANGALATLTGPLEDLCWTFPSTTYPTHQWSSDDVYFGAGVPSIAISPYYATDAWFMRWSDGAFAQIGAFDYPSTASYDAEYPAARPNAYPTGTDYITSSHVANGLLVHRASGDELDFFTSGRFVRYAVGDLAPAQLLGDIPYLTGGRTDIAGRNYGLVAPDPNDDDHVTLVAGTSTITMLQDMTNGAMTSDVWGGIERHVSVVDVAANTVDDRFFSYAHDGGDADQYEGRVVFPGNAFVDRGPGQASPLAFNVYEGGRWWLHVTAPGATSDAATIEDLFLWDIRDLDGDGIDEWIVSPARDATDPDVPGYYFVKWRTAVGHWDDASATLSLNTAVEGSIPYVTSGFRDPTHTSSDGYLVPALTVVSNGALALASWTPAQTIVTTPLAELGL